LRDRWNCETGSGSGRRELAELIRAPAQNHAVRAQCARVLIAGGNIGVERSAQRRDRRGRLYGSRIAELAVGVVAPTKEVAVNGDCACVRTTCRDALELAAAGNGARRRLTRNRAIFTRARDSAVRDADLTELIVAPAPGIAGSRERATVLAADRHADDRADAGIIQRRRAASGNNGINTARSRRYRDRERSEPADGQRLPPSAAVAGRSLSQWPNH
jgi:hypothetical protein